MTQTHDDRRAALRAVGFAHLVALFGNMVAVASVDPVAGLIAAPELLPLDQRVDAAMRLPNFSFVAPFPVIVVLISLYLLPALRSRNPSEPTSTAAVRLLNAPFALAMLTVSGWLLGTAGFLVQAVGTGIALPAEYVLQVILVSIVLSTIAFVIIYYLIETFNRSYTIPRLYPAGGFFHARGLTRATTRTRLLILYIVTSLMPMVLLARIALLLNNGGANPYNRDLSVAILTLIVSVGMAALVITLLKAAAIASPVGRMVQSAERIRQFDFTQTVPVRSTDELGLLGERMNEMAAGLGERERMRDVFGRVVDPSVRDRLMAGEIDLGGEEIDVSVVFIDVVSFTTLSEKMAPAGVVELLNIVFSRATALISATGGHVDKYIGDAVMALFGTPTPLDNHALAAVEAVRSIMAAVPEISAELEERGLPPVRLRAGVHSGRVLAGTIGSRERMEYTVIGDVVNTASRLVGAAKEQQVYALASQTSVTLAGIAGRLPHAGAIEIRGRSEPVEARVIT